MKLIIAYVQPFKAPRVVQALHEISGVTGATFTDARGFGRGRTTRRPDAEELFGAAQRLRVELVVHDELEDAVVSSIREAAHTGNRGDGKIYVVPVARAVRIATGEEGENAI